MSWTDLRSGCCTGSQKVGLAVENSLVTRQSALVGGQAAASSLGRKWSYEQNLKLEKTTVNPVPSLTIDDRCFVVTEVSSQVQHKRNVRSKQVTGNLTQETSISINNTVKTRLVTKYKLIFA